MTTDSPDEASRWKNKAPLSGYWIASECRFRWRPLPIKPSLLISQGAPGGLHSLESVAFGFGLCGLR